MKPRALFPIADLLARPELIQALLVTLLLPVLLFILLHETINS